MVLKDDWVDEGTPGKTEPDWTFTAAAANAVAGAVNLCPPVVDTLAELRDTSGGYAYLAGYYAAADGGGGLFRWDDTDTTSDDNGGTNIVPNGGLAAQGRWKRVFDGSINARWFGVNPSQSDNTQALQDAVDFVAVAGGIVFIPAGVYPFTFDEGASGLSTITVDQDYVTIVGENKGTRLRVDDHSYPDTLDYFFTFQKGVTNPGGQGGGIYDLLIDGNAGLKWGIYLGTWHAAHFERITVWNMHGGVLDACGDNTIGYWAEQIVVRDIDAARDGVLTVTQYGIRFRPGPTNASNSWSDCFIENCILLACWDTGVLLDGCVRFRVRNIGASHNGASANSIDGTSKAGCLHAVRLTNSIKKDATAGTGYHVVDGVYLESYEGSETVATNNAVLIDTPVAQDDGGHNRYNVVSNTIVSQGETVGMVRLQDDLNGGYTHHNTIINNLCAAWAELITIGSGVADTILHLTPVTGTAWSTPVADSGTRTTINGFTTVPSTATSAGVAGMLAADDTSLYVCTAANVWRKVTIASW